MANTVYFGGVGNPATLKLAFDYAKTQGYETNGQETFFVQAGNISNNDNNDYVFAGDYPYTRNVTIHNPNGYTYTKVSNALVFLGTNVILLADWIVDGIILNIHLTLNEAPDSGVFYTGDTREGSTTIKNCHITLSGDRPSCFYIQNNNNHNLKVFNNVFIGGDRVFSKSIFYGGSVALEDNVFIAQSSWGTEMSGSFNCKRNYSTITPNGGNGTWYYPPTYPFNDTTFFDTSDHANPLYLVPRASYNWGVIDQTSNIPENIASKNGVTYTGLNRAVGCMALPDNVVEPVISSIVKQGGNTVRLTWNGTAGGVIYTNEVDNFSTAREVATATSGSTYDYAIPLEDRGKVMHYWVEVL